MSEDEKQTLQHVVAITEDIEDVKYNQVGVIISKSAGNLKVEFVGNGVVRIVSENQVEIFDASSTGKKPKACSNKDDCPNWDYPRTTASTGRKRNCQCYPSKICITCGVLQNRKTAFGPVNKYSKDGRPNYRPHCEDCYSKKEGKKINKKEREKEISKILTGTLFKCPICEKVGLAHINVKIVIDHGHKTGKIRGPICDKCNTGLGRWDDDPVLFMNAINWLTEEE